MRMDGELEPEPTVRNLRIVQIEESRMLRWSDPLTHAGDTA